MCLSSIPQVVENFTSVRVYECAYVGVKEGLPMTSSLEVWMFSVI